MAWPISLLAGAVTGVLSGFGIGGGFGLLNADGAELALGGAKEWKRDMETGNWIVTWSYPEMLAGQVAGVCFWQPNCILLEDEAVTIPLS